MWLRHAEATHVWPWPAMAGQLLWAGQTILKNDFEKTTGAKQVFQQLIGVNRFGKTISKNDVGEKMKNIWQKPIWKTILKHVFFTNFFGGAMPISVAIFHSQEQLFLLLSVFAMST